MAVVDLDELTLRHGTLMTTNATDAEARCPFCRIAADATRAVVLYEDADVVAFLDRSPIRQGHTQIISRLHVPTFEQLPAPLAAKILHLGQQLATRMKAVYAVERVAFFFTGGDVPHAHAHVVPMHEKTDITSARYIVSPPPITWSSAHLAVSTEDLIAVRDRLA
jgi:histidine triad (HIT) family protein